MPWRKPREDRMKINKHLMFFYKRIHLQHVAQAWGSKVIQAYSFLSLVPVAHARRVSNLKDCRDLWPLLPSAILIEAKQRPS